MMLINNNNKKILRAGFWPESCHIWVPYENVWVQELPLASDSSCLLMEILRSSDSAHSLGSCSIITQSVCGGMGAWIFLSAPSFLVQPCEILRVNQLGIFQSHFSASHQKGEGLPPRSKKVAFIYETKNCNTLPLGESSLKSVP